MNFTNDEMNLMCIYNTGSRESLMRELREMRGYIGADQPELLAMENCRYDNAPLRPWFDKLAEVVRKDAHN